MYKICIYENQDAMKDDSGAGGACLSVIDSEDARILVETAVRNGAVCTIWETSLPQDNYMEAKAE